MKINVWRIVISILTINLPFAGFAAQQLIKSSTPPPVEINQIIAFGDSLTDTGNLLYNTSNTLIEKLTNMWKSLDLYLGAFMGNDR